MNWREYLLTTLSEECTEVAQRVSKSLRFGLDEVQPGQSMSNADRICLELDDLHGTLKLLHDAGIFTYVPNEDRQNQKVQKILNYAAYAELCKTLTIDDAKESPL